MAARKASPEIDRLCMAELQAHEDERTKHPKLDLSDVYRQLIDLVKGGREQEALRLLESFEWPIQ